VIEGRDSEDSSHRAGVSGAWALAANMGSASLRYRGPQLYHRNVIETVSC
jgi:hypothetical protein